MMAGAQGPGAKRAARMVQLEHFSVHSFRSARRRAAILKKNEEVEMLRGRCARVEAELASWQTWWRWWGRQWSSGWEDLELPVHAVVEEPLTKDIEHKTAMMQDEEQALIVKGEDLELPVQNGYDTFLVDSKVDKETRTKDIEQKTAKKVAVLQAMKVPVPMTRGLEGCIEELRDELFQQGDEDADEHCDMGGWEQSHMEEVDAVEELLPLHLDVQRWPAACQESEELIVYVRDWLAGTDKDEKEDDPLLVNALHARAVLAGKWPADVPGGLLDTAVAMGIARADDWCFGHWEEVEAERLRPRVEKATELAVQWLRGDG